MRRCAAAVAILVTLTACAGRDVVEPAAMPTIVRVPVTEYVAVPARLTKSCPVVRAKERTVEAVVSAYNANVTSLEGCNAQLRQIEGLGQP